MPREGIVSPGLIHAAVFENCSHLRHENGDIFTAKCKVLLLLYINIQIFITYICIKQHQICIMPVPIVELQCKQHLCFNNIYCLHLPCLIPIAHTGSHPHYDNAA